MTDLSFDIPIRIPTRKIHEKKLSFVTREDDNYMPFYVAMDGFNLINFYNNGEISINTSYYKGREYHYELSSSNKDEVRYRLVPSIEEKK